MSACAPLALQAVSQLLEAMGEPQRLSLTETELEREQRLLKQTCNLKFMSWFDGSPILNRSWVTHYVMLHYDSLRMRLSSDAQVACRRACSNPPARVYIQPPSSTAIQAPAHLHASAVGRAVRSHLGHLPRTVRGLSHAQPRGRSEGDGHALRKLGSHGRHACSADWAW